MATGGESPYGVLQPQHHGGFVMGTDLRTAMPTSGGGGGWYHEQPELQQQIQSVMTSLENVPQPENTVPKDSGRSDNILLFAVMIKLLYCTILFPYFVMVVMINSSPLQRVMCLVR